jgi:hypothetical protein
VEQASEVVGKVYAAIGAVQRELCEKAIGKEGNNAAQGFRFRGIDQVHNTLSPILARNKLLILPSVVHREQLSDALTKSGGTNFRCVVTVQFVFVSTEDGSRHSVIYIGESADTGDKGTSKALSMAYKYFAIQSLCIPVQPGSVDDADGDSPEPATKPNVAPKAPSAPTPAEPVGQDHSTIAEFTDLLEAVKAAKNGRELTALKGRLMAFATGGKASSDQIGQLRTANDDMKKRYA